MADKEKEEVEVIDIAIPCDSRIKDKEQDKMKEYEQLKEEIGRQWNMKKVTAIPVVIGPLACSSHRFESYMEKIGINMLYKRQHSFKQQGF